MMEKLKVELDDCYDTAAVLSAKAKKSTRSHELLGITRSARLHGLSLESKFDECLEIAEVLQPGCMCLKADSDPKGMPCDPCGGQRPKSRPQDQSQQAQEEAW